MQIVATTPAEAVSVKANGLDPVSEKISVLYIGGYGRSGSTVFGTILNCVPRAVHAGELVFLPVEWSDSARRCSCGKRFPDCAVWRTLDPNDCIGVADWKKLRRLESLASLPRVALGLVTRRERVSVQRYVQNVLVTLAHTTGARYVIDSSKTARAAAARPLALARIGDVDLRVVHLVRDGRKCLQALLTTGSNWKLEGRTEADQPGALRVTLGWMLANASLSLLGAIFFRGRYAQVRYEDFLDDPSGTLEELGHKLDLDLSVAIRNLEEGGSFGVGHVLGGNRLRFEREITLLPKSGTGNLTLTRKRRILFAVTAGWLNILYGYGL